jgi:hypothetical protein
MVITPRRMGNVMVESGCTKEVSVRKDSESKGVGSTHSRDKTTDMRRKTGN